ncbi:MAG: glycine dehydrogenase (aminomethyl-transferring), partial [Phycisphaerales bacterium]
MSTTPTAGTPAHPSSTHATTSHGFDPLDTFARRHLGPDAAEVAAMLETLGVASVESLMAEAIPAAIRMNGSLELEKAIGDAGTERGEHEMLSALRSLAAQNEVFRSYIGMGYHGTITPPVVLRNVLENPGWYTQYTPYQAEIAQGRLEALLNFQTMICELTGLPVAGASLLDEGTAAAEAMSMCLSQNPSRKAFFVAEDCHPQTIAVV